MAIAPVTALPEGFATLRAEAAAEGFNHIETMWSQWQDASLRFTRPGEKLFAATIAGDLAGIGGITQDFMDPLWLRMRRFYVRPRYRRSGVAAALAGAVLDHARPLGRTICLHTDTPGGTRFWQAMGFVPIERENTTHVLPAG